MSKKEETMDKLKEITERYSVGYTMAVYGTREGIHKQMREDIHTLIHFVKNNDLLHSVSESNFNDAIKYIEDSYCDAHLNTPYMLLGDVAELIKILTGKEVDWQELAKHSR